MGGYSTLSLGYIGLYELTKLMKGVTHTKEEGQDFAVRVMQHMRDKTDARKRRRDWDLRCTERPRNRSATVLRASTRKNSAPYPT